MKKEKFKFNQETFQFEKVEITLMQRCKKLGIHFGFSLLLATIFIVGSYPIVKRIIGKEQFAENQKLKTEYKDLSQHVAQMGEELALLRLRDDSIYSSIFGVEPVASALRGAGTGGSDNFEHLKNYQNSDLMISSAKKIAQLQAKIGVHRGRFSKIQKLSSQRLEELAAIPAVQPIHNHNLIRTSSGFGMRIHPVYGVEKMHTGIDFTAKTGTKIFSTGDGVVTEVINDRGGYGKHVVVSHGFGYETLYAHMNRFAVRKGQKVKRGELLGYVGNSGTSTAPHLHYEVIKDGKKINPADFFFNDLSYGEYSEMVKISSAVTTSLD